MEGDRLYRPREIEMIRALMLVPLFLGTLIASAPAETTNPMLPTAAVVNDDIRGTADGILRVHHSGNARLRGELRSDSGGLVGTRAFAASCVPTAAAWSAPSSPR